MANSFDLPSTFRCTKPVDFSKEVDTGNLKDKSVIVTGGASGLGAGFVNAIARAGAYVTILDINEEKGNAVVEKLTGEGFHVQFVKTDIASFSSQNAGFKSAISFSPSNTLDIVITSAGVTGRNTQAWLENAVSSSPENDEPEPPSTAAIDVNLTGSFYSAHLALYHFKKATKSESKASSKQVIFISSLAGYLSINNADEYGAGKFGVRGMWKAIRHSVEILGPGTRFRTNLIAPTYIRTDMTTDVESILLSMGIELGEIEDVVAGVMRVACDEEVSGRAVATVSRDKIAGDRNFDLCDDWEGLDAGTEVLGKIRNETIKNLHLVGYPSRGKKE